MRRDENSPATVPADDKATSQRTGHRVGWIIAFICFPYGPFIYLALLRQMRALPAVAMIMASGLVHIGLVSVLAQTNHESWQKWIVLLLGAGMYGLGLLQYLAGQQVWGSRGQRAWKAVGWCMGSLLLLGLSLQVVLFHFIPQPKSRTGPIPEVSRQAISREQVGRFVAEINRRSGIRPQLDAQTETHFELVGQILPDAVLLSLFDSPHTIRRRVLLEYHDTLAVNGMLQSNCAYELGDCELMVHLTVLPDRDPALADHMRKAWKGQYVTRTEQQGDKDILISQSTQEIRGTIFGRQILLSLSVRKPRGMAGELGIDEKRLWKLLQYLATRIE